MKKAIVFLVVLISFNFLKTTVIDLNKSFNRTSVIIKPGMNLDQISEILYSNQIIPSQFFFKFFVKLNFIETKLKFGEFLFHDDKSIFDIIKKLKKGESIYRKVTIVEGSSKFNLLKKLKEIDPDTLLTISDIPDNIIANTYKYVVTDDAKKILKDIIKLSSKISNKVWNERDMKIPLNSINEIFVLASIVEKETSLESEKSKIAGVFYNRLKKKMRLQSDPTVVFALTKGKEKLKRKLLRKDLKFESVFNTYQNSGLPPETIGFPSYESLIATSQPYNSNLLYFVANRLTEGHLFSSSYKEHLRNIKAIKNEEK